ncbi:MAG: tetratricopeptide repeat protein [Casimicrobiaceae bacterium]
MRAPLAALSLPALLAFSLAMAAAMKPDAAVAPLDGAALDGWWDFARPAESEARFRAELSSLPAGSAAGLELLTQIARAQGLQRRFDAAGATLDQVEQAMQDSPPRVEVRYLLERGRVYNSSRQPERALPLFEAALSLASSAHEDFLAVDAAHMLGIAAAPADRLRWDFEAVAMAERSTDPRARRWLASLYNNIGWTWHERGDYARALEYFEKALPLREARGDVAAIRTARWMIARALRSLGRYDGALAIQQALLEAHRKDGSADGYVFEELGELELARGHADAARPWFAQAARTLGQDAWFAANEPARLERLRALGGP